MSVASESLVAVQPLGHQDVAQGTCISEASWRVHKGSQVAGEPPRLFVAGEDKRNAGASYCARGIHVGVEGNLAGGGHWAFGAGGEGSHAGGKRGVAGGQCAVGEDNRAVEGLCAVGEDSRVAGGCRAAGEDNRAAGGHRAGGKDSRAAGEDNHGAGVSRGAGADSHGAGED